MQNDETTLESQEEQQEDTVAETTDEGTEETTEEVVTPKPEETDEEILANYHKYGRLANKKGLIQKPRPAQQQKPQQSQTLTPPSDETVAAMVLKSQGKSDEDIAYLKKIAAVNGTDIIDAQKDELYTAYEAKKEAAAKSEQASLGASKGSGAARKQKTTTTAGLTEQEHKELWRKQNGL